jgi:hypothetical protein
VSIKILDEDNMASDSAVDVASQQSIKKYVDDQAGKLPIFGFGDGSDGALTWTTAGGPYAIGLWQATTFTIALGELPTFASENGALIIQATTSITINGELSVSGKGARGGEGGAAAAEQGESGVFGGSGGGGDIADGEGGNTFMTAGATSSGTGSAQSTRVIDTLILSMPVYSVRHTDSAVDYETPQRADSSVGGGGGSGHDGSGTYDGGHGGGVIVLVAPVINFGASSIINVAGLPADSTRGGGGGGGAVIYAYGTLNDSGATFTVNGGAAGGTEGGAGGAGWSRGIPL